MNKFLRIYTRLVLALMPLFFLPVIYDGFGLGKVSFLVLSGGLGLIFWVVEAIWGKKTEVKFSKGWWLIVLLGVWSVVSFLRMSQGAQARSITSPLGIGSLVGLIFWFFLWLQVRSREEYEKQLNWLTVSAVLVGITSLVVFVMPESKLPFNWPKDNPVISISNSWSVTGSLLSEVVLFGFLTVEWVRRLVKKIKNRAEFADYFKEAIVAAFLGLMVVVAGYRLVKLGWLYLDLTTSWVIAVETLKNSPLFGVGLGNFVEAFSRFRPASFNMTDMWVNMFGVSLMGIFHWWTELGLVGLGLILILMVSSWKQKNKLGLVLLGSVVLLTPPVFLTVFLMFWVMATFLGETKEAQMILEAGETKKNIMPYIVGLLVLVIVGFAGYKMVKPVVADYYWRESLTATVKNDATGAYNNQIKAIGMNPNLADYRAMYSQTNLALARNYFEVPKGEEMTEENKQKASTLIQQAVREAQAAVGLDQKMSGYWVNLGSVYRSLIGLIDNTFDWSVQSYQQAAVFDPVNPNIKMELGSLAYGAKDYASAERYFEDAVNAKPNLANAWYNWAYAAKQQNKIQEAVTRLDQSVKLVPADSEDYEKANKELTEWKKELDEAVKKYQEVLKQQQEAVKSEETEPALTTPQPLPTIEEEDQVVVPTGTDLAPPIE
jgi:Tfp pilus assembly protein PilF